MGDVRFEFPLSAELIRDYHELTGGSNPIHVDHDFAVSKGFRAPLAHGNLLARLALGKFFQTQFGIPPVSFDFEAKFIRPVCAGDLVSAVFHPQQVSSGGDVSEEAWRFELEALGSVAVAGTVKVPSRVGQEGTA